MINFIETNMNTAIDNIQKNQNKLENRLNAGLGAMNMIGVMEGKTSDGAIRTRDKIVIDTVDFIKQSHISFIENEIERLENMMKKVTTDDLNVYNGICGYNKAIQDQIDYYKKTLELMQKL